MKTNEIAAEAVKLVKAFEGGELHDDVKREAADLADYWLEFQFARADIECNWGEAKCERMFTQMRKQLRAMGLP
jgi:hypothetical protein